MSLSFCAKPKRKCGAGLVLIALVPADGDHRVVGSGCGGNDEEVSAQEPGCALHSNAARPNHVFPPARLVRLILMRIRKKPIILINLTKIGKMLVRFMETF